MRHVIYQGREYVLMREWADRIELADAAIGAVLNVRNTEPEEQRRVYEGLYNVERPLTGGFHAYAARPKEALTELRRRRTTVLLGKPPKKARARKPKSSLAGDAQALSGVSKGRARKGRTRASSFIIPEAQLMHLPADVRAKIMADVKKLGESK